MSHDIRSYCTQLDAMFGEDKHPADSYSDAMIFTNQLARGDWIDADAHFRLVNYCYALYQQAKWRAEKENETLC